MNSNFKKYFEAYINDIAEIINKLQISNDKKTAKSIAHDIVEIEVLMTLLNAVNEDFYNELSKNNSHYLNKKLINKISDIRNILYSLRLPHWNILSFKGKMYSARLHKWFFNFGTKSVLIEKFYNYFTIAEKINECSNEKISFIPLIAIKDNIKNDMSKSKESILNICIFNDNNCFLNLENLYLAQDNLSCQVNRYEIYKIMISKELNSVSTFAETEIQKINNLVFNKKSNDTNETLNNTLKEFVVKTSLGKFRVNEDFRTIINDSYKDVIKRLKNLNVVEKRDKVTIEVSLDELFDSAKLLDSKLGGNRFVSVLSAMDFIDPVTKKKCNIITFDGLCNMVGMVNTGKTTFMLIVAIALFKKGYKTGLVLRDNDDVLSQCRTLFGIIDGINAVPLLGNSTKKNQSAKVLNQNIESSTDLESTEVFDDVLYEYTTHTCPLKACIINDNEDKDIFNDLNESEELLCDKLYCNDAKIICPFVYNCDSISCGENISNGNIFLTNTYSFIQTTVNKYFIEGEKKIAEFMYDSCDLVLCDESDIVQFISDCSFVNASPVYNVPNNASIIEKNDEYFVLSQGKVMDYIDTVEVSNLLNVARISSFNLLKLLSFNLVPNTLSNGPINSKSTYGFLSWLLTREVDCIKSIASATTNLNKADVTDFSDENFEMDNEKYKLLVKEFKDIATYIYLEYKKEYDETLTNIFSNTYTYKTDKYEAFSYYINSVINQASKSRLILEKECLNYILDTKLCNETVVELIRNNDNVRSLVLDILSFALILNKLECDLMQIINKSQHIKSKLGNISQSKNIDNIPAKKEYVKKYQDVLSKCPLEMSIGLKYDRENASLSSILWNNTGRELFYNYNDLWKYVRGDKNSGVNVALLSGTSFMPSSPLYHIDKPVNYLIKTKKEKPLNITFLFEPEKDEDGNFIFNSGINKAINGNGVTVYKKFAKALCREFKGLPTKLDFYLKEYTYPGRNRILVSVGTYEHAMMLASYIHEKVENIPNSKVKVASLVRGSNVNNINSFYLPPENCLTLQSIKEIEKTPFNIVVVPQAALQRGINMVGEDIFTKSKNGKKVASFSCLLKTNRDYQIPNSNEYAVSRVNHKLNRLINSKAESLDDSYNLDDFVKNTILELNKLYDEYYITKYFADLSDEEREMIIADLCVEDFQFIGRIIRGDSDAFVIMADASFFRAYTKDGSIDNEKTSTIAAIKWLMERLKQRGCEHEFLIEELYSPFLNGIYKLLDEKFNL